MPVRQQRNATAIFFAGASEGDALAEITRALMKPFVPHAARLVLIDIKRPDWLKELTDILTEPVWFAASFFGDGQNLHVTIDGTPQNLWEYYGIPFVRYFGDLPAYFPELHLPRFRNSINAYFNPEQHTFFLRWFPNRLVSLSPPPVLIDPTTVEEIDLEAKRNGRIVFPKNGNSPARLREYWRTALPKSITLALESIAEDLVAGDAINLDPKLDDRLLAWFIGHGIDLGENPPLMYFLAAQLDDYLRRVKSTMIAEALLDLPVIIRGRNWEHVEFSGRRATYDPRTGMAETLGLIDQAPAIIDMSPNTQLQPHDRILRALGRHTAFLTNRQRFLDDSLGEAAGRCSFDFDLQAIQSLVEHYVAHPADAVELGCDLARRLAVRFDPESCFAAMVIAIDATSLACGPRPQGTQDFVKFSSRTFEDT